MTQNSLLYYTRCPAPTATGVSAGSGLLQKVLSAQGFEPRALQDVQDPEIRRHHFEHGIANLIREGGNIPAIWAESGGARTRLLGITWLDEIQAVVVAEDSTIQSAAELKGARLAVPATSGHRLDVSRISAVRGLEQALGTAGLSLSDAILVDVAHRSTAPGERGGEHFDDELAALANGDVDAVWLKSAAGASAIASGKVRVIVRLDLAEDRLVRVNNGTPRTLTFHEDFIAQYPQAVAAVLATVRQAVEAIGPNRSDLWALLAGETGQSAEDAERAFGKFATADLLPDLTDERLQALQHQADFLFRHDFIPARVDVRAWALPSLEIAA